MVWEGHTLLAALLADRLQDGRLHDRDLLDGGIDGDQLGLGGMQAIGALREHLGGALHRQLGGEQLGTSPWTVCTS